MPQQHYRAETYAPCRGVGFLLKRAHLLLVDRLEPALVKADLTFTQWVILMHLREGLAVNATVLCAQLRHDSGALTRVLDQLEARALIERERSRADRRSVQLRLTERGRDVIEALLPAVVDRLNESLGGLSRSELAGLTQLLTKLIAQLEVSAPSPAAARSKDTGDLSVPEESA